ncbi:MAG TPA: His/Gly/Thr/Pro-type tRNA ligase C-terminal domain-containing protein, partial [Candidatus Paceibacterota bacterium]
MSRTASEFVAHAGSVAGYYGFKPLRDVDPQSFKSIVGRASPTFDHAVQISSQSQSGRDREPVLSYFASTAPHTSTQSRDSGTFHLQVTHVPHALGDTMVIKTAVAILQEWGAPVARVRLNVFGDRDSRDRFSRELTAFVRRRFASPQDEEAHEIERRAILEKPTHIYHAHSAHAREALAEAPRPVHFLSEKSRSHFKELLEHLERIEVPYELDDMLHEDTRDARIAFRIDVEDGDDDIVEECSGGRFDDHAARLVNKRDYPTVHGTIAFAKKGMPRAAISATDDIPPRLYFIQLGIHAKLCGLSVVDILRRSHIPLAQSFDSTKLSPQLSAAQRAGVPLVLIMGEREARDNTVIVRRVSNSSQVAVPITELS